MGLVIRTLYNNQNWKAPCVRPGDDPKCLPCFTSLVNIKPPKKDDEICKGNCWERDICVKFRWGCTPQGRTFARAYKGMKVFLTHRQFMGGYTIWGITRVAAMDYSPLYTGLSGEDGFSFIYFEPFEPLPQDKMVSGLSDNEIVGEMWRQGRFRYIDTDREQHLEKLIAREGISEESSRQLLDESPRFDLLSVKIRPIVLKRLDQAAREEGRTRDEIVREAIAEWLRARGQ